jgi:hypothetical protein
MPIEEEEEEKPQIKFLPNNTKKNRRRYRRHIRKERKSYFREAVENKTWDTHDFEDQLFEWFVV